jgi:hypothetical protein
MVILNSTKLKNDAEPQPLGVGLVSTLISLTGILFISLEDSTTLTCWRQPLGTITGTHGVCTVTTARPFVSFSKEIEMHHLIAARLKRLYRHRYHMGYQVVLQTATGEIPITSDSPTERSWKEQIAADINRFLKKPGQTDLQLQLEHSAWTSIFGFSLVAIGTGAGLFARQITQGISSYESNA